MSRDRVDIHRRWRHEHRHRFRRPSPHPLSPCGWRIPHRRHRPSARARLLNVEHRPASETGRLPVAAHLGRLLRLGEITPVPVPDRQVEVVRDPVRAREAAPMRPDNDAAGSANRRAAWRQPCSWSAAGRFPGADGQHGCRTGESGRRLPGSRRPHPLSRRALGVSFDV